MFKRKLIYTTAIAASLGLSATFVNAQQVETTDVTLSVSNTFDFDEVAALSFGTIRVSQTVALPGTTDLTKGSSMRIFADGSAPEVMPGEGTGTDKSVMSAIAPGSPAEYGISGAAPNTRIFINEGTGPFNSAAPITALGSAVSVFNLTMKRADVLVVGGPNDGAAYNGFNLTTDATGTVGFRVGGTLTTALNQTSAAYGDGDYSGTFTIQVDY